jgi:hypothetical protein
LFRCFENNFTADYYNHLITQILAVCPGRATLGKQEKNCLLRTAITYFQVEMQDLAESIKLLTVVHLEYPWFDCCLLLKRWFKKFSKWFSGPTSCPNKISLSTNLVKLSFSNVRNCFLKIVLPDIQFLRLIKEQTNWDENCIFYFKYFPSSPPAHLISIIWIMETVFIMETGHSVSRDGASQLGLKRKFSFSHFRENFPENLFLFSEISRKSSHFRMIFAFSRKLKNAFSFQP